MNECITCGMRHPNALIILIGSFACIHGDFVKGVFKIESPFGRPVVGMTLTALPPHNDTATTDSNGKASLRLTPGRAFVVQGRKPPSYQDLYIFGNSGTAAQEFNYTTYFGTRLEAKLLAGLARVPYNASAGYVVIGMDNLVDPRAGLAPSNLVPAIGATASISGIDEQSSPFLLLHNVFPVTGRTVTQKSSSFVTFPNVDTGEIGTASATLPGQDCVVSPALAGIHQKLRVYPDSVSVTSFVCQTAQH